MSRKSRVARDMKEESTFGDQDLKAAYDSVDQLNETLFAVKDVKGVFKTRKELEDVFITLDTLYNRLHRLYMDSIAVTRPPTSDFQLFW